MHCTCTSQPSSSQPPQQCHRPATRTTQQGARCWIPSGKWSLEPSQTPDAPQGILARPSAPTRSGAPAGQTHWHSTPALAAGTRTAATPPTRSASWSRTGHATRQTGSRRHSRAFTTAGRADIDLQKLWRTGIAFSGSCRKITASPPEAPRAGESRAGGLSFLHLPLHNQEMHGRTEKQISKKNLQYDSFPVVRVAINEAGYRIGESHHNSKISDEVVNRIRDLHEDQGIGYRRLARMFNLKKAFVQKVCNYAIRAQTPAGWKRIAAA